MDDIDMLVRHRHHNPAHYGRVFAQVPASHLVEDLPSHLQGNRPCSLDGCSKPVMARTYCAMHWQRYRKYGDPGPAERLRRQHDGPTYSTSHDAVRRLWGPARQYQCVTCTASARCWAYDGTDPTQRYGPNCTGNGWHLFSVWPEFYMPLCSRCHNQRDGAIAKRELHEYRLMKYGRIQ